MRRIIRVAARIRRVVCVAAAVSRIAADAEEYSAANGKRKYLTVAGVAAARIRGVDCIRRPTAAVAGIPTALAATANARIAVY